MRIVWPLLIAIIVLSIPRLIPTVYTGQPFSTDVWPLMKLSVEVVENPGISIYSEYYGGYHNKFPAVSLYSIALSKILGLEIPLVYRYIIPLIIILVITLYGSYIIGKNNRHGYLTLLYIGLIPSFLIYTSTVTKEGFSYIFLVQFLILLDILNRSRPDLWVLTLSTISIFLISISNILTAIIFLITSYGYLLYILLLWDTIRDLKKIAIIPLFSISIIPTYILLVYPSITGSLIYRIGFIRAILIAILITAIIYVRARFSCKRITCRHVVTDYIVALTIIVSSYILTYYLGIFSIEYLVDVLLYSIPFIPIPFLILYSRRSIRNKRTNHVYLWSSTWILLVTVLMVLMVVCGVGYNVLHRLLDLLLILSLPIILLRTPYHKYLTPLLLIALLIPSTILIEYRLLTGEDNISYYWLYRSDEIYMVHVVKNMSGYPMIGCDVKTWYLFRYYGVKPSFYYTQWLTGIKRKPSYRFLVFLYREDLSKGLVYSIKPAPPLKDKLQILYQSDLIYMSNNVVIYYTIR